MVLEKRAKVRDSETWIGVNAFPYVTAEVYNWERTPEGGAKSLVGQTFWQATSRNYALFAALANVRGHGPAPKGIPDDASDLALMMIDEWGEDGHSHTWFTMDEALPIFLQSKQLGDPGGVVVKAMQNGVDNALAGLMKHFWTIGEEDQLTDFRLVMWFDN